jgi:hypothetical protein
MTTQHDGRPLSDVAPGVEEDLGLHDDPDRKPTPEEKDPADESPDRKVAKNYEEAMKRRER